MSEVTMDEISIQIEGNSDKAIDSLTRLTGVLEKLTGSTGTSIGALQQTNTKIKQMANISSKTGNTTNKSFKDMGKSVLGFLGKLGLVKFTFFDTSKYAAEFISTYAGFNKVLGTSVKNLDNAKKFVNDLTNAWYLDEQQVMQSMSRYYNMTSTMGFTENAALRMSKNLTALSYDLQALGTTGATVTEVQNQLASALRGEAEGLAKFGISLNQATLQSVLYEKGINRTVSSLTAAQKAEVIYYQIMRQTYSKHGYYADQLGQRIIQPAMAAQMFQNQIKNLARAMGSILIPVITKIMPYLISLTNLLTSLAKKIATLFGFKLEDWGADTDKISSGLGDIGASADAAGKKIKGMIGDFDELHTISFDNGGGAGAGAGGSLGLDASEFEYDFSDLEDPFKEIKEKLLEPLKDISFDNLASSINRLKEAISPLLNLAWDTFYWAYTNILAPLAKFTVESLLPSFLDLLSGAVSVLTPILEAVVEAGKNFFDLFLKPIAEFVGEQFIEFINNLADILSDLGTWFDEHKELVEQFTFLIMTLGTAFLIMHSPLAAIIGLVVLAVTVFNNFYEENKELVETILAIVAGIALAVVAFNTISKVLTAVKTAFSIVKVAITGVQLVFALLTSPIGIAIAAITAIIAVGVLLYKNWDTIKEKLGQFVQSIKDKFEEIKTNVGNKITELKTNISNKFQEIKTNVTNKVQEIKTNALNKFEEIKNGIKSKIDGAKEIVKKAIEAIKGFFKFEWSLPKIKLPHFGIEWDTQGAIAEAFKKIGLQGLPKLKVDFYAEGGFPNAGDLFIANESGAEWVGSMNGRTAVANQDQITTGVRQAAYEGMKQALAESDFGGVEVYNYLDSKDIASKMTRVKKSNANMYG